MNDWNDQSGIERATGSEELDWLMQQELRDQQMQFYKRANTPPFDGFGGLRGLKDAATGVAILFILGIVLHFVFGVG